DVMSDCRRLAFLVRPEQKELRLHPGVHREAEGRGTGEHALQDTTRIAGEWLTVWCVDVADHSADAALGITPRKDLKSRQIRREEHVRLLDPHEPLDRGSVEHDVAGQRL